ncbi:hypothetical protein DRQ53_15665, partial [bacterium]
MSSAALGTIYEHVHTPNLAVGVDGDVYVAFNLFIEPPAPVIIPDAIGIARGDGGGTWSTSWSDAEVALTYEGYWKGANEPPNWNRVWSYPVLAVDHSQGTGRGTVYLTWVADDSPGNVWMASNVPGAGATPDFSSGHKLVGATANSQFMHWAACDPADGRLWVAYYDCQADVGNAEAVFSLAETSDGGNTWITRTAGDESLAFEWDDLNMADPTDFWGHYPTLAVMDGYAVAMWMAPLSGSVGVFAEVRQFPMFVNRSDDTGFNYAAAPYSSIPFDYEGDGDVDLFLTNQLGAAGLMENTTAAGITDIRAFTDRRSVEFVNDEAPEDARGASVADFDNDGDLELFIAAETDPRLYDNTGPTSPLFADISDSLIQFTAEASDSWAGAWGDFDRDGWVDLYIARAGTSSGAPFGALADRILRNMGGEWLKDVSADLSLTSVTGTTSTGAAWADADGDGELDVFVSALGAGEASKLLIQSIAVNPSTDEYEHTFADSSAYIPPSLGSIAGASWRDLNNDGDLDLLLSGTGTTSDGSRILWNDGYGDMTSTDLIGGGFASRGHELLDADLDGGADILLAPASPAEAPGYFHNNHDGPETTFADLTEIAGVRVDSAYAITAISAVDIAGASDTPDGDEDLYIGRASSSNAFFYQNAQGGTDAPTNKWLKVKLDPDNRPHNGSAIGVTVKA